MAVADRVKRVWNAFTAFNGPLPYAAGVGVSGGSISQPGVRRTFRGGSFNERSIVTSMYTRMSIDIAGVEIRHVKVDESGRYAGEVDSKLNQALTLEPNIDQGPRAFRQDLAMTLFESGAAAIVPVDTSESPQTNERFDIYTLRVGEIVEWYPKHVKVSLYNVERGERQEITLEKRFVAIVENPLYSVMNEPNSTLQRLIRKLAILDAVDEQSGSGKLDIIIQLPYVIKSEARRIQAEKRRTDIEHQLKDSRYGIAYTDGTEKITQLNRPAENNLLAQIEYLMKMLHSQLGLTEEVMMGTADEAAMLNYLNRTVEPIMDATVQAMQRSFLGPMGTAAKEKILYFRDPFKLVPITQMADIADKFSRNEILTPNEIRILIGMLPSTDPKADQLKNSNMPSSEEEDSPTEGEPTEVATS